MYRDNNVGANENPTHRFQPVARFEQPQINLNSEWRIGAPAVRKAGSSSPRRMPATFIASICATAASSGKSRVQPDLYLAGVFHGKALIVGKSSVKALDLANGNKVWEIDNVGMPSGQGTADNIYYLPLKAGPDKDPEVCAIDIASGKVVARTKSRKKEIPGNLVFYEGEVLSQGLDRIASYPQVQKKLALIDDRHQEGPQRPGRPDQSAGASPRSRRPHRRTC